MRSQLQTLLDMFPILIHFESVLAGSQGIVVFLRVNVATDLSHHSV